MNKITFEDILGLSKLQKKSTKAVVDEIYEHPVVTFSVERI